MKLQLNASTREVVSQDRNVRFRGMNRETSFLLREFALVYSGTKRSTTSEGLREAAAEDSDVRKRKENIKINNGL